MAVVFTNGKIFTGNPDALWASAFAVENGRVVWIGEDHEVGPSWHRNISLNGRRVLPGLIDAHAHPLLLAEALDQIAVVPPNIRSIADLQRAIKEYVGPGSRGDWILGWGYDESKMREQRYVTRWDLDAVSPHRPVMILRACAHMVVVNSVVLERLGIGPGTANPDGGEIVRDAKGIPTGLLKERAKDWVYQAMPEPNPEAITDQLGRLNRQYLSFGVTGTTELMARRHPVDDATTFEYAINSGKWTLPTTLYYLWSDMKNMPGPHDYRLDSHLLKVAGIKVFTDGSISGKTAHVDPPYVGGNHQGMGVMSCDELREAYRFARDHGLQLAAHAMGEIATAVLVDCLGDESPWLTTGPSIRIEHAALLAKKTIERAVQAKMAFVSQPIFLFAEIESYLKQLGRVRTEAAYPYRTLLAQGALLALSSDAPSTAWAEPHNPFVGIATAIRRRAYNGDDVGQDEGISLVSALLAYTRVAAHVSLMKDRGQLRTGYWADFMIMDHDLFDGNLGLSKEMPDVIVKETYQAGQSVFTR